MPSRESKAGVGAGCSDSAYRRPPGTGEPGDAGTTPAPSSPAPYPPLVTGMCCGEAGRPPGGLAGRVRELWHQTRGHDGWHVDGGFSRGSWAWLIRGGWDWGTSSGRHTWVSRDAPAPSTPPSASAPRSSSLCLGQFPASRPLHLPMEPDAALGKIPSGVCCLSPPS